MARDERVRTRVQERVTASVRPRMRMGVKARTLKHDTKA